MGVKKRVLLVINSDLINAGVPNVVMNIVRNLSKKFSFDIITYHNKEGIYDKEFELFGGKIFRIDLLNYNEHKILFPLRYFQIRKCMNEILNKNTYDIIHCHNGIEAGIFLKYARCHGISNRIVHAHGTYYRRGYNKILLWYNWQCKKMIHNNATTEIACSTQAGKSLFFAENFVSVFNPVDISLYRNVTKKIHSECNLLQIGYFCENKNQLFSIKLLAFLLEEKVNIKLTFIGSPQNEFYYNEMLNLIKILSLQDKVFFLPSNTDKAIVFSETDIVLMPSFTEGLPLVALESQAARIPVVLSDHISEDANIGLATYAKYNDIKEWGNAIRKILNEWRSIKIVNVDTDNIEINRWCERIGAIYDEK